MSEISVLRREIKYVVAETEAAEIKRELAAVMSPDAHSPSGSYRVRSLYFDTLNNRDYFVKLAGIESRSKLRLRVYSASDETAKLEIKRKWGEYQRKDTLTLTRRDAERLIRGEYVCLLDYAGALPAELYARLTLGVYRPAAMIEYRRTAFTYPAFNTRLTIDSNIRSDEACTDLFSDEVPHCPVLTDRSVLEVKFNGRLVSPIRFVLNRHHLTGESMGKYAAGRPLLSQYV